MGTPKFNPKLVQSELILPSWPYLCDCGARLGAKAELRATLHSYTHGLWMPYTLPSVRQTLAWGHNRRRGVPTFKRLTSVNCHTTSIAATRMIPSLPLVNVTGRSYWGHNSFVQSHVPSHLKEGMEMKLGESKWIQRSCLSWKSEGRVWGVKLCSHAEIEGGLRWKQLCLSQCAVWQGDRVTWRFLVWRHMWRVQRGNHNIWTPEP